MRLDNFIELRKFLGISQEKMAKLIGVDRSTYAHYENGSKVIPIKRLNIISNKYNVSLNFLTGLSRENNIEFKAIEISHKQIGKNLKKVRKDLNLTQVELAKKLFTGHSSISEYEKGMRITVLLLIDYAKITGKSIDYLCGKADE